MSAKRHNTYFEWVVHVLSCVPRSYDYGEKFWMVKGKLFTCKCGSSRCKFNERRIQRTISRFEKRDDDDNDDEDEDERRVGEELQLQLGGASSCSAEKSEDTVEPAAAAVVAMDVVVDPEVKIKLE